MQDILDNEIYIKIEPVNKGWSGDKKYCVETKDGKKTASANFGYCRLR